MKYYVNRGIVLLLTLMMLTACGIIGATTEKTSVPLPLEPSKKEREILKKYIPEFYVKFTNQQVQLRIIHEELSQHINLGKIPEPLDITKEQETKLENRVPILNHLIQMQQTNLAMLWQLKEGPSATRLYSWESDAIYGSGLPNRTARSLHRAVIWNRLGAF